MSRNIYFHENPNAVPATSGFTLNPQINGGDYWGVGGRANYNAMLAELKHQFSQQFMGDAQFAWSKSMDTSSAPYSEQPYPYDLNLDYGSSDYNVGKAFKVFGMWQPVMSIFDDGDVASRIPSLDRKLFLRQPTLELWLTTISNISGRDR